MSEFPKEICEMLGYYVYRLIDPRNNKTFYVGKGCNNRVFAHVNDKLKFAENNDDNEYVEDEISAKMQTIRDIHNAGKEVKHVIHRFGLTEKEALELESALIDVYSELGELTNINSGFEPERGLITTDELINNFGASEYEEPSDINYVIVKTKYTTVENCQNSLYEASRKAWSLSFEKVKDIHYVLSTISGRVKEVYEIDRWYRSNMIGKVEFEGHVADDDLRNIFIHKLLPPIYRKQGNASSALYKKALIQPKEPEINKQENDLKIGKLAQETIPKLIAEGKVSNYELELMLTEEYSKHIFNLNFPVLATVDSDYKRRRYYTREFTINGVSYVLCNHWFENETINNRPFLEKWIKEHDFNSI